MRKGSVLITLVLLVAMVIGVSSNAAGYACGTYFPNWAMYNAAHQSMNVGMIPWNKVTFINHAFFTVTSNFTLATTDEWADFQASFAHSDGWDVSPRLAGHFAEYRYYKTQYPNVKILVSIGGWTRGENFHAMASTASGRTTFINSCISFLKQYPFIDGLDFDWEYPGVNRPPDPNDPYDRGCPGGPEDTVNFTTLLSSLRTAYNNNGLSDKLITVAGPGGYDKVDLQQPQIYKNYVDWINVMTYDIHGAWETKTNLQAALCANPNDPSPTSPVDIKNKYNISYIMNYYKTTKTVPGSKLNVGMPFYSRGWKNVLNDGINGLFASASGAPVGNLDNPSSPGGQNSYPQLLILEGQMTKYRDSVNNEPYLYSGGIFYTYDDTTSIGAKCDWTKANGYGGVFSWEISCDTASYTLQNLMWSKMQGGVSSTPTNTNTPSSGATPTNTNTPSSVATPTNTNTNTPSSGATPTNTNTNTPSSVATPTNTNTPTASGGGAPAWQPNTYYAVNALCTYGGKTYKCIQAHTSLVGWEPPNVPALWQLQ